MFLKGCSLSCFIMCWTPCCLCEWYMLMAQLLD